MPARPPETRFTAAPRVPLNQRGFNSVELVAVLALAAICLGLTVPPLMRMSARLRVRAAAKEVASVLLLARSHALRYGVKVGVKFRPAGDGSATYTLHRDGDGDGVRSRDIDDGSDPRIGPHRFLNRMGHRVGFGIPPGLHPTDPSGSGRLGRLGDPIRFNRSDVASFSPLGTATPGSLYLSDRRRTLAVVRLNPGTARIRILLYDPETEEWR